MNKDKTKIEIRTECKKFVATILFLAALQFAVTYPW